MDDDAPSSGRDVNDAISHIAPLLRAIEDDLASQLDCLGRGRLAEVVELSRRVRERILELKGVVAAPFPFPDRLARIGRKQQLLMLMMDEQRQSLAQQMRNLHAGRKLTKAYR
jgi:hypothetical protein